ncbi:unnamed protein product [Ectocarpus fasciculatus]
MSVLLETSAGEIVIDLFVDEAPLAAKNFLKLCKVKYYNSCLFFNVQTNFIAQCGDPTGTGKGGSSVYGLMYGPQAETFADEIKVGEGGRKHDKVGLVCMANTGPDSNKSQFFITLRAEDLQHLDSKHTIFGEVAEGVEVLDTINNLFCDEGGRPYQDVRVKHTHILDDPYPDPPQLEIPPSSPIREVPAEERVGQRIPFEEPLETVAGERTEAELEESIKRKEAHSRAIVLEMTGDIPDAEVKPPEEVLFVCKLNPVTTDDDLEILFSRFGKIKKCEIIRDSKTGDSLNYAFIEFETEDACIEAYEKMNNVLIDDRRIKVDFSQSVTKLWNKYTMKPVKHRPQHQEGGGRGGANHYQPPAGRAPPRSNVVMKSNSYQLFDSRGGHSDRQEHRRNEGPSKHRHRSRSQDRDRHRRKRSRSRDRHERRGHEGDRRDRSHRRRSRSKSPRREKEDRHRRE